MSKKCLVCNTKLGLFKKKCKFLDGFACEDCVRKAGYEPKKKMKLGILAIQRKLWSEEDFANTFVARMSVGSYLKVDDVSKKFEVNKIIYNYENLVAFELLEDDKSVTKSGLGRAVVGGALFGTTGAVVGAITGQKQKSICKSLKIMLTLKDVVVPVVCIPFLSAEFDRNGTVYTTAKGCAESCVRLLNTILQSNEASQNIQPANSNSYSEADELAKFKKLLDEGAITQEEYDKKKKDILGV